MMRGWMQRLRAGKRDKPPVSATAAPAPSASSAPKSAAPAIAPETLANPAIERLAEDESLRGDLTDDGYGPLQQWAFDRLTRVAHEAAHHPAPQAAMDGFATQIRAFVSDAVQAAQAGKLGDLTSDVKPRVVLKQDAPAVVAALQKITFTQDADANAQAIATALRSKD